MWPVEPVDVDRTSCPGQPAHVVHARVPSARPRPVSRPVDILSSPATGRQERCAGNQNEEATLRRTAHRHREQARRAGAQKTRPARFVRNFSATPRPGWRWSSVTVRWRDLPARQTRPTTPAARRVGSRSMCARPICVRRSGFRCDAPPPRRHDTVGWAPRRRGEEGHRRRRSAHLPSVVRPRVPRPGSRERRTRTPPIRTTRRADRRRHINRRRGRGGIAQLGRPSEPTQRPARCAGGRARRSRLRVRRGTVHAIRPHPCLRPADELDPDRRLTPARGIRRCRHRPRLDRLRDRRLRWGQLVEHRPRFQPGCLTPDPRPAAGRAPLRRRSRGRRLRAGRRRLDPDRAQRRHLPDRPHHGHRLRPRTPASGRHPRRGRGDR